MRLWELKSMFDIHIMHRSCIYAIIFFVLFPMLLSQDMCCSTTSYGDYALWSMCSNAADPNLGTPDSCDTCFAYHCIDWYNVLDEICTENFIRI